MDSRFKPHERRPGGRVVGTYFELWSPKVERRIRLDSGLEFHLFLMVEANWEISCFCEHPCILNTDRGRQPRRGGSIPDMWIRYRDAYEEIVEAKYSTALSFEPDGSYKNPRLRIQKEWCEAHGVGHRVVTELQIRKFPNLLKNWELMVNFISTSKFDFQFGDHVLAILKAQGRTTWSDLRNRSDDSRRERFNQIVFHLLYRGKIASEIRTERISAQTELWVPDEPHRFEHPASRD